MTISDPTSGPYVEAPVQRRDWLDRLRGLAIVLMVLDHALVAVAPASVLRLTATRLSAPLFMLCLAVLWKPGLNRRRLGFMLAAVFVEYSTFPIIGIPTPGIMVGIVLVTLAAERWPLARHGWACTVAGLVAWVYWGFSPGVVLMWWGVGRLAAWQEVRPYGERLPAWLARLGRHPLGWYVGHLSVLAVLVAGASA